MDLMRYAKFGTALLGAAAVTLNYAIPIMPPQYQTPATLVLVFLTALGVYAVPNTAPLPVGKTGTVK